jgi:hypothetical protein
MGRPKRTQTTQSEINDTIVTATQIDPNSPEADRKVIETLYKMVIEDRNTTAAIFWAKTRCGMREESRRKERAATQIPTIVIRSEEKRA